eukprot:154805-Prymnesium_polylepis.1
MISTRAPAPGSPRWSARSPPARRRSAVSRRPGDSRPSKPSLSPDLSRRRGTPFPLGHRYPGTAYADASHTLDVT